MTDVNQNNYQNNEQSQEMKYQNFDNYQEQKPYTPNNQDQQQYYQDNQNQQQYPQNNDYSNQPLLDNRPKLQDNNQTNQDYQNYTPQMAPGNYQPAPDPVTPVSQPYPQPGSGPMVSPVVPPISQPVSYPMVQPFVRPGVQPNPGVVVINQDPFYARPVQNVICRRVIFAIMAVAIVIIFIVPFSVVFSSA